MQRGLPVVEVTFGQDGDEIVGVEVDGVGVGRRNVVPEPAADLPGAGPEKVFAARGAERAGEARILDARGSQDLPGIGRPDDADTNRQNS